MYRNKKAQWMWLVYALIAIGILVVSWIIIGKSLAGSKLNLDVLQSCEGQKGKCEEKCADNQIAHYKALGCGSEKDDKKVYCCITQT